MANIFEYDNLIGRPPGRYLRIGAKLFKGIRSVQEHIPVYAADWLAANAREIKKDKPLWVVLGDSMAQGIGASSYQKGWAGQLHGSLKAAGYDYKLINLSISGARIEDILDRQLPAMEALGERPVLVTVMIGSNNLLRKRYRLEAPEQFATMLQRLPHGSVVANLPGNGPLQQSIAHQVAEAAHGGAVRVADMRLGAAVNWRGKLAADHFHPNDAGYAILTNVFETALELQIK